MGLLFLIFTPRSRQHTYKQQHWLHASRLFAERTTPIIILRFHLPNLGCKFQYLKNASLNNCVTLQKMSQVRMYNCVKVQQTLYNSRPNLPPEVCILLFVLCTILYCCHGEGGKSSLECFTFYTSLATAAAVRQTDFQLSGKTASLSVCRRHVRVYTSS